MTAIQTDREKLLQRIVNLRAKAEDDAASEAEMNAAFNMAAKLMVSYQVEEAELALAESQGRIVLDIVHKKSDTRFVNGKSHRHKVFNCLTAIAKFTSTKCVVNTYDFSVTYTGHRPDVEWANYLTGLCKTAIDRAYESYRASTPAVGYGAKTAFQLAMANRIARRLADMAESNKKEYVKQVENKATSTANALVFVAMAEQKQKAVEDSFASKYSGGLRTTHSLGGRVSNGSAYSAGVSAGNKVNFGRAIGK
jgi:hypothetical protein